MTIDEIKKEKEEFKNQLENMLDSFTKRTGFLIHVQVSSFSTQIIGGGYIDAYEVKTTVSI